MLVPFKTPSFIELVRFLVTEVNAAFPYCGPAYHAYIGVPGKRHKRLLYMRARFEMLRAIAKLQSEQFCKFCVGCAFLECKY